MYKVQIMRGETEIAKVEIPDVASQEELMNLEEDARHKVITDFATALCHYQYTLEDGDRMITEGQGDVIITQESIDFLNNSPETKAMFEELMKAEDASTEQFIQDLANIGNSVSEEEFKNVIGFFPLDFRQHLVDNINMSDADGNLIDLSEWKAAVMALPESTLTEQEIYEKIEDVLSESAMNESCCGDEEEVVETPDTSESAEG